MTTYAVRLEWPPEWSPELDAGDLLRQLDGLAPIVDAGDVVVDDYARPWTVTVCGEGRTPRLAAQHALDSVEPLIGTRVSSFRVGSSARCGQLAAPEDAVPDLVPDDVVRQLIREQLRTPLERLEAEPDFPAAVVETKLGVLRDLDEVLGWLSRQRAESADVRDRPTSHGVEVERSVRP